jgi:RHS repeat-associated protein
LAKVLIAENHINNEFAFVYNAAGQLTAEYQTNYQASNTRTSYLTADHLGSPRVTTDSAGVVKSRHDYYAFGEEISSGITGRLSTQKYVDDSIRQQYTGYERDDESGLDYAQARYYSSQHGRFTSVDPLMASATIKNPQTFNRYSYALNSPYKFTDPLGLAATSTQCGQTGQPACTQADDLDQDQKEQTQQQKEKQNPTNPDAPVPGTGDIDTPNFGALAGNERTQAAYDLLKATYGDKAESVYNGWSTYQQAVYLNTIAALADAKVNLDDSKIVGFYNDDRKDALPFGVTLSNVTKKELNDAGLGPWIGGRRSPKKIEIASLEATIKDEKKGIVGFDIDLYNAKSKFPEHQKEVSFNSSNKATTHPADVARALKKRGVISEVTTK